MMWTFTYIFMWIHVFFSFRQIPRNGSGGSLVILCFSFGKLSVFIKGLMPFQCLASAVGLTTYCPKTNGAAMF